MGDFRLENQRVDSPFRCLGGARQLVLRAVGGGPFASQRDGAAYALPVVQLFEFGGLEEKHEEDSLRWNVVDNS